MAHGSEPTDSVLFDAIGGSGYKAVTRSLYATKSGCFAQARGELADGTEVWMREAVAPGPPPSPPAGSGVASPPQLPPPSGGWLRAAGALDACPTPPARHARQIMPGSTLRSKTVLVSPQSLANALDAVAQLTEELPGRAGVLAMRPSTGPWPVELVLFSGGLPWSTIGVEGPDWPKSAVGPPGEQPPWDVTACPVAFHACRPFPIHLPTVTALVARVGMPESPAMRATCDEGAKRLKRQREEQRPYGTGWPLEVHFLSEEEAMPHAGHVSAAELVISTRGANPFTQRSNCAGGLLQALTVAFTYPSSGGL